MSSPDPTVAASSNRACLPFSCLECHSGFIEEIPPLRHRHRSNIDFSRSQSDPVIVLRSPLNQSSAELFYDDGTGSGLRPLPPSMSDFFMGSGLDRILDQLTIPVGGGLMQFGNTPASKAAVESLPSISIAGSHLAEDSCCAVCKEAFELECEARELPCRHIFHRDCILPWLSLRSSCPVCRHELPADARSAEATGLAIWRLPRGGLAVGRLSHGVGRLYADGLDSSFGSRGVPRTREHRGVGRMVHNFFSIFGCFRCSSSPRLRLSSESAESQ